MKINDYAKLIRHLEDALHEQDLSRDEHKQLMDDILKAIEDN